MLLVPFGDRLIVGTARERKEKAEIIAPVPCRHFTCALCGPSYFSECHRTTSCYDDTDIALNADEGLASAYTGFPPCAGIEREKRPQAPLRIFLRWRCFLPPAPRSRAAATWPQPTQR